MEEIKEKLLLSKQLLPQKFNWLSVQRMQKALALYEGIIAGMPDETGFVRLQFTGSLHNIKQLMDSGVQASSWKKGKILLHQACCKMDNDIDELLLAIAGRPL